MKNWWSIILIVILVACQNSSSKNKNKQEDKPAVFGLFNLTSMYSDAEQNVSFPVWFNDSIVREHQIAEITRLVYDVSSLDTSENLIMLPKKKYTYQFQRDGSLKQLIVSNFYDDKIISSIKIVFSKFDPKTGYAITKINDELEYDHKEFPFVRYNQISHKNQVGVYQNSETETNLFIVSDPKLSKPLAIDTLCNPTPEDIIVLGSFQFPTKKYSVQNLVEEMNVRTFNYKNDNLISIDWKDDPFTISRTFHYSKKGICTGFDDVTNSMGAYVSSYHFSIEEKDGLPKRVTKSLKRDKSKYILLQEDFEYGFFENK